VAGVGAALPAGNPLMAGLVTGALVLLAASGVYGSRFLDRFRDELPADAVPPVARRLYWRAVHRGLLDENYARAVVGPTVALGRTLRLLDRRLIDRATGPVTPAGRPGGAVAGWEARFATIRRAHDAGFVTLAEPPALLDWLPPHATPTGRAAAHPRDVRERLGDLVTGTARADGRETGGTGVIERAVSAVARLTEQVERVAFQGSAEGRTGFLTAAIARTVETIERIVFQAHLERAASLLTTAIAKFAEAVEHVVFQSGIERGLHSAGTRTQSLLLTTESRLGQPFVMGGLLVVVLGALLASTL